MYYICTVERLMVCYYISLPNFTFSDITLVDSVIVGVPYTKDIDKHYKAGPALPLPPVNF